MEYIRVVICVLLVAIIVELLYVIVRGLLRRKADRVIRQQLWCTLNNTRARFSRRERLLIFGNNAGSRYVYTGDKNRSKFIVDDISSEDAAELYTEKIRYLSVSDHTTVVNRVLKDAIRKNRSSVLVVNTMVDEDNVALCRSIVDGITAAGEEHRERIFKNIRVFVFGDPRYETIYEDIVSGGFGCIHYINKYRSIAIDFIDRYPFASFMTEEQVDYTTSCVKEGVNINVFMIGFGQTNQQVFLTSVANNQFIAAGDRDPILKPVTYYIFDKEEAENNKNLNHNYYRFAHECADINARDYLPLPDAPAKEVYCRLDINDSAFYDTIRDKATAGKHDANFVIIAFGSDLENIDMAQKLVEKRREWGLDDMVIFVRVNTWRQEQCFLEEDMCYFFANENEIVYNIDRMTDDRLLGMSQMRNEAYDVEYEVSQNSAFVVDPAYLAGLHANSLKNWHKKSRMERESSIYGCLSLRSKLNLMGLDYCAESEAGDALTEEEYLSIYAEGDMPLRDGATIEALGKPIVTYTLDFPHSRRRSMAVHEHHRWNSFMISHGMVPASKDQILNETTVKNGKVKHTNGKNYAFRRHGNLTTFDGLEEFRRLVSKRDGVDEASCDVIKYDYQLLDDAYWFLSANGYKIIRLHGNVKH